MIAKEKQIAENSFGYDCLRDFREALKADNIKNISGLTRIKKLRSCSADVFAIQGYYILRSYSTIIAIVDIKNSRTIDFLRIIYGHTNTSVQHISKFSHDYGGYGSRSIVTIRPCCGEGLPKDIADFMMELRMKF